jgi:hypothetical protein
MGNIILMFGNIKGSELNYRKIPQIQSALNFYVKCSFNLMISFQSTFLILEHFYEFINYFYVMILFCFLVMWHGYILSFLRVCV